MDIYIKANKEYIATKTGKVTINNIAEISAPSAIQKKIENTNVFNIKDNKKQYYAISIIQVIDIINKTFPGHTINSIGSTDTVIKYVGSKKEKNFVKISKILIISIILLAGSATAIMSFHSDAQMSTVFENYYSIFFNERVENPAILAIPYSLGLFLGIIIFFNHFTNSKITNDPTPIEVEMTSYNTQILDNVVESLSNKESKNDN